MQRLSNSCLLRLPIRPTPATNSPPFLRGRRESTRGSHLLQQARKIGRLHEKLYPCNDQEQYPEPMTDLPQPYSLDGKPFGPNCSGLYPWAKGCREYFSAAVVRAVHIGIDWGTTFDAIPATFAMP